MLLEWPLIEYPFQVCFEAKEQWMVGDVTFLETLIIDGVRSIESTKDAFVGRFHVLDVNEALFENVSKTDSGNYSFNFFCNNTVIFESEQLFLEVVSCRLLFSLKIHKFIRCYIGMLFISSGVEHQRIKNYTSVRGKELRSFSSRR